MGILRTRGPRDVPYGQSDWPLPGGRIENGLNDPDRSVRASGRRTGSLLHVDVADHPIAFVRHAVVGVAP